MTIKHIEMFSFQEGTTEEQIEQVKKELSDLPNAIPGLILSSEFGKDLGLDDSSPSLNPQENAVADKHHQVSWEVCFASAEDYQAYKAHGKHVEFINKTLQPIVASRSAVQYEIPGEATFF